MSEQVHSLTELAERLFSKPPVLQVGRTPMCYARSAPVFMFTNASPQGIDGPGVAQYVNASVSDIEEGLVRQLLNSELCTAESDLKEFVSNDVFE